MTINKEEEQLSAHILNTIDLFQHKKTVLPSNHSQAINLILGSLNSALKQVQSAPKSKNAMSKERQLMELFYSYTKKAIHANKTFDAMAYDLNEMQLAEYIKFNKDFNIQLPLSKIRLIFLQHSCYAKSISMAQFIESLNTLAKEECNHKKHKMNGTEMQANSNEQDINSQFLKRIGIDDKCTYKKIINSKDKPFNGGKIESSPMLPQIKPTTSLKYSQIKKTVQLIRQAREERKQYTVQEKEKRYQKNAQYIKKLLQKQTMHRIQQQPNAILKHADYGISIRKNHASMSNETTTKLRKFVNCIEKDDDIDILKKFHVYDSLIQRPNIT